MTRKSPNLLLYSLLLLFFVLPPIVNHIRITTEPILISGTGSMYPTFPKGITKSPKDQAQEIVATPGMLPYPNGFSFLGISLFSHTLGRGDIVTFRNPTTEKLTAELYGTPSGLVKRTIALPGETIEIRDGQVLVNQLPLSEPYIARARSTFGGSFLPECRPFTIPSGQLFVMGDNRKASGDSRHELGLISQSDVHHVLPFQNQHGKLDTYWRDTSRDLDDQSKINLDTELFIKLLNEKRSELKLPLLKSRPQLGVSAAKRARIMLEYNDFSYEATKSGYTMKKALTDANYSNILYGEYYIPGHYESEELLNYMLESPEVKKFLFKHEYQDIGLSQTSGKIDNCPTQIIVIHTAGYIPPNYSKELIDSWKQALTSLREIAPGWANLKTITPFYEQHRTDIDRINIIIQMRIQRIERIVARMTQNQYLTREEETFAKEDRQLASEEDTIANRLNSTRE